MSLFAAAVSPGVSPFSTFFSLIQQWKQTRSLEGQQWPWKLHIWILSTAINIHGMSSVSKRHTPHIQELLTGAITAISILSAPVLHTRTTFLGLKVKKNPCLTEIKLLSNVYLIQNIQDFMIIKLGLAKFMERKKQSSPFSIALSM